MKQTLIHQYKDNLINIYCKDQLKSEDYNYILVLKDLEEDYAKDSILYTNYERFYEHDYLKINYPKTRKPKKLLTYQQGLDILSKVKYGALAITNDIPYLVNLSHFIYEGELYFHCAREGYKLRGLDQLATYSVVLDDGINPLAFTQNFRSVIVFGKLEEVTENKKVLLDALCDQLTPGYRKDLNEHMINNAMVLKLPIHHMTVKQNNH